MTDLAGRLVARGVDVVAVTERPDSPFAASATAVTALPATASGADPGDMIALASTLAVGAWGDALAVVAMALRGHALADVIDSHPAGGVGHRGDRPGDEVEPVVGT
jgi:arabinose-5-phosphate isomerase